MKPIIGRIEPEDLRQEIIFAKGRVKIFSSISNWNIGLLRTWSRILNHLVKRIVPVE